jgi:CBS domain-containing protein
MGLPNSSSTSVITQTVVSFLQGIPPFQFLQAAELTTIAAGMSLEYFPKNTLVLSAGSRASDSLYIIKKGGVKLAIKTDDGAEVILDMRGEGEFFGFLSTMGGEVARLDVTTVEDTLCYSLPATEFQQLSTTHAEIAGYFLRTSVTRYVDRSLAEIRERARGLSEGERLMFSLSVVDLIRRPVTKCDQQTTVQAAARQMAASRSTSIVVADEAGHAIGIVTDKDLREKVVAQGAPLDSPVGSVMSSPVITVDGEQRVFEALLQMLSHNVHHLVVTEQGATVGVITNHDLLLLQGKSPLAVMRHLGEQRTLNDLIAAQARAAEVIPLLISEGAKASHITRVVAEINDRVLLKIIEFAEAESGPPPLPYCWVAMGSEGRREQTFKTDQDNGLIYQDPEDEWQRKAAKEYFTRLTAFIRAALERCGYPPCEGGYMASNLRWRQSLADWKRDFEEWITDPDQKSASDALIFFDMRPIAGNFSLFEELRGWTRELLTGAGFFKSLLAYVSIGHKPPLGFFRGFVLQRSGEHKHEFDLKLNGTGPIVNAARLFAVDADLEQTNTIDRLSALQSAGYGDTKLLQALQEAVEFLMMLRLQCQTEQVSSGKPVSNYVNPDSLTSLQKGALKQSFQAVAHAQSVIRSRFEGPVWSYLR